MLITARKDAAGIANYLSSQYQVRTGLKFDGGGSATIAWLNSSRQLQSFSGTGEYRRVAEALVIFSNSSPPPQPPPPSGNIQVTALDFNPPSGNPRVGDNVSVHIRAEPTDQVDAVRLLIDGSPGPEFGGPDGTVTWNTGGLTAGSHTVTAQARARSANGSWSSAATRSQSYDLQAAPPPSGGFTISKTGNGTVTSDKPGINCGSDCNEASNEHQVFILTATPDPGWAFSSWGSACLAPSRNQCLITINVGVSRTLTVTFIPAPPLTLTASPTSVAPNVSVSAAWANLSPSGNDWISLHATAAPDSQTLAFRSITGASGSTSFSAPSTNGAYEFRLFRNGSRVAISNAFSVSTSSAPIPGDIDGNGRVDIFDYNTLLTNFGRTGCGVPGDIDGNCIVDIFDYNIILTNFGRTTSSALQTSLPQDAIERFGKTLPAASTSNSHATTTTPQDDLSTSLDATQSVQPGWTFGRAYIAISAKNSVAVIDTAINSVTKLISVGASPSFLAINQAKGRVYVANTSSNSVSVIDSISDTVVSTIPVGNFPQALAVNSNGNRLYVTNSRDSTVSIIDTNNDSVIATVVVGAWPRGIVTKPSATHVYVVNGNGGSVTIIDASTNTVVANIPVGQGPSGIDIDSSGRFLYVSNFNSDTVSVIDTDLNSVISTIAVGNQPFSVSVNSIGKRVFVTNHGSNSVSIIDSIHNTVLSNNKVGIGPLGTSINGFGVYTYASNYGGDSVSVINPEDGEVVANIPLSTSGLVAMNIATDHESVAIDFDESQVVKVHSEVVQSVASQGTTFNPYGMAVETLTTPPAADLAVTGISTPESSVLGASLAFTLTVRNNGPATATGVVLSDSLPPGAQLQGVVASQGSCSGTDVVSCGLGTIASGAAATVTITVTTTSAGVLTNTATVVGSAIDPVNSNNTATMSATISGRTADLAVSMSGAPAVASVGDHLTYVLTIKNNGPAATTGVRVTDLVFAGASFQAATVSQGSCAATDVVRCDLGTVANGSTSTIRIEVVATAAGSIVNTAIVTSDQFDPDTSSNEAAQNTTVLPPPPCNPRPNVKVTTIPIGTGRLRVTVSTQTNAGLPANALAGLSFTRMDNGTVQVNGAAVSAGSPVVIPPGTQQFQFDVIRQGAGAVTIHFTVRDACGDWPTFVGGGPNAF